MSPSRRLLFLFGTVLALIIGSWGPSVGVRAVSASSSTTTWQILQHAFHRYGVSPYPEFVPGQSAAPSAQQQDAAVHGLRQAAAADQGSHQCSAYEACSPLTVAQQAVPAGHTSMPAVTAPADHKQQQAAAHSQQQQQQPPNHNLQQQDAPTISGHPPQHHQVLEAAAAQHSVATTVQPPLTVGPTMTAHRPSAATHLALHPAAREVPASTQQQAPAPAAAPARPHRPSPVRRLLNLAELSDGASVLAANVEARRPERAIDRDIDSFMKNDCDAEKWMMIELSQLGTVETVKLTMKELYSSRVHTFRVLGRSSHPRKDGPDLTASLTSGAWQLLGSFTAENKRGTQSFSLPQRSRVRYLLLMFDTHYGNEQMCAMNWIEVLGVSAAQELEEALALQEIDGDSDDQQQHPQQAQHHDVQQQQIARHVAQHPQVRAHQLHHSQQQHPQYNQQYLAIEQQRQQQPGEPPSSAPEPQHSSQGQRPHADGQIASAAGQVHLPDPDSPQSHAADGGGQLAAAASGVATADAGSQDGVGGRQPLIDQQQQQQQPKQLQGHTSDVLPGASVAAPPEQVPLFGQDSSAEPDGTGASAAVALGTGQQGTPAAQDQQQQQPHLQQEVQPAAAEAAGAGTDHSKAVPPGATASAGAQGPNAEPSLSSVALGQQVVGRNDQVPGQGAAVTGTQQPTGDGLQQQQQVPPGPAAHQQTPPAATGGRQQQPQQHVPSGGRGADGHGAPAPPAAGDSASASVTTGQEPAAAAYTAGGHTAGSPGISGVQGLPTQQVQAGAAGSTNSHGHQQHRQQSQIGQTGGSTGSVQHSRDTGSVLDSRGSNKPKQAGNLFDVVKSEMMQLKLDQGKLTKKVDGLTKRSGNFEGVATALQQQQAALSSQVERLSKKLDALIGTQAAANAAQQQLRKDVSTLLAAQKDQRGHHRRRHASESGGTEWGVTHNTVLPDVHVTQQPSGALDTPRRPLMAPMCARPPAEQPPLLLQFKYQWSVVTALAGTSLLGLWLVLHPKSWGCPQVLRLVVCVLALLNGILALLLGLWLLVMQGLAAQQQRVLLLADPGLSTPVYRMLSNGSAWGDAAL